jgi:SanA protein
VKYWLSVLLLVLSGILVYRFNAFSIQKSGAAYIVNSLPSNSIIVLPGTGQAYTERPNHQFNGRVMMTVELMKTHPDLKVLISGHHDGLIYHESTDMAAELIKSGIDPMRISYDSSAYDSFQTILNLKQLNLTQTIIFVSQKEHLERMLWISNKLQLPALGLEAKGYPQGSPKWLKSRERLACVKARLEVWYYKLMNKRI